MIAKVYCFWGQSNITGWRSDNNMAPAVSTEIWYNETSKLNQGFHRLQALKTIAKKESFSEDLRFGFGPEMQFGASLNMSDQNVKHVVLKHSLGGTNMLFWTPQKGASNPPERSRELLKAISQLDNCKARLELMGYTVQIEGIFWMQGESDADDINYANAYGNNIAFMINEVRNYYSEPNLKFFIASPWNTRPYINTVRSAINGLNLNNVFKLDTFGLSRVADSEHLSTSGQIALGQAFYNLYEANN